MTQAYYPKIAKSSFENLDNLSDKLDWRSSNPSFSKLWYEVRSNLLNIALNDLLSETDFCYNDYNVELLLFGDNYIVRLNKVVDFNVSSDDIQKDTIQETTKKIFNYITDLKQK